MKQSNQPIEKVTARTVTALLKIYNDLLTAADSHRAFTCFYILCFNTQDTACAIPKLEKCIDEIEKWMVDLVNKLNGEKNRLCHHRVNISSEKV